jgi:ABC-type sugar transport system ATPase subunit
MAETVAVAARALAKSYGRRRVITGVTFEVERGQICGLLGPNGAGKTTTMRVLAGLSRPDDGAARLLGEPSRLAAPVLARVGVAIDGPAFVPHLSGRRNLELAWRASGSRWPPPAILGAAGYVTICLLSIGSIALALGLLPRSVEALGITIGFLIGSAALDNVSAVHDIIVILPVHYWLRWTQLFGGDASQILPGLAAQVAAIAVALTAAYALLMWRDPAA